MEGQTHGDDRMPTMWAVFGGWARRVALPDYWFERLITVLATGSPNEEDDCAPGTSMLRGARSRIGSPYVSWHGSSRALWALRAHAAPTSTSGVRPPAVSNPVVRIHRS